MVVVVAGVRAGVVAAGVADVDILVVVAVLAEDHVGLVEFEGVPKRPNRKCLCCAVMAKHYRLSVQGYIRMNIFVELAFYLPAWKILMHPPSQAGHRPA